MSQSVGEFFRLSKHEALELAGRGRIAQTGGEVIADSFALPQITAATYGSLPSIETFVLSADRTVTAMGSNEALIAAWMPAVERLAETVLRWTADIGVEFAGDTYITASITPADEVNGEAHFDDDQFDPTAGAGFVAIVGDLGGPRVAAAPLPHDEIKATCPVVADDAMKAAFADGTIPSNAYGPNELVALPQFAQLHAGPGPCGSADEVRHLLVFRGATTPTR